MIRINDDPECQAVMQLQRAATRGAECYAAAFYKPRLPGKELAGAVLQTRWFLREVCEAAQELEASLAREFGPPRDTEHCLGCEEAKRCRKGRR